MNLTRLYKHFDLCDSPLQYSFQHCHGTAASGKLGCTWKECDDRRWLYSHVCVFFVTEIPAKTQRATQLDTKMQQQQAQTQTMTTESHHTLLLSKVTDTVCVGERVTRSHTVRPHQRPQRGGLTTSSAGSKYSFLFWTQINSIWNSNALYSNPGCAQEPRPRPQASSSRTWATLTSALVTFCVNQSLIVITIINSIYWVELWTATPQPRFYLWWTRCLLIGYCPHHTDMKLQEVGGEVWQMFPLMLVSMSVMKEQHFHWISLFWLSTTEQNHEPVN